MFAAISIILLINIYLISSKILISQNDEKCVEVSNLFKLFKQKSIFYLNAADENPDDILKILHKNENLLTLFDLKHDEIHFKEITINEIFLIQVKSFKDFLNFVESSAIKNSKGKYLILNYGDNDSEAILKVAWKYYLLNINVVTIKYDNVVKINSYLPYSNNNCHNVIDTFIKNCQEIVTLEDLFPNKVPFDLKGCDTRFGVFMFPPFVNDVKNKKLDAKVVGLEGVLFKTILEWINSKENLTLVSGYDGLGTKYPNGTMIGALSNLKPHKTDILFGHLWPNISFSKETDMFYPFYIDSNRWYVPKALQLAKWKCLFVILQAKLWGIIFLTFVINAFVWWAISNHTRDIQTLQNIGQCLLYGFYVLCLGSSPWPNKFIMRFLVINWTLYSLLLAVMYQSQLLTILTSPTLEHQLTDLEELPGSKLRVLCVKELIPTLKGFPKEIQAWILQNADIVEIDVLMRKMIQYDRTFIFVSTYYWMKSVAGLYYTNADGSPMVHDYDEEYTSFNIFICAYASKGFPLLDRFNKIGFRLHAAGFLAKWLRDIDSSFYGRTTKGPVQLTLDHVAGGFYLLVCGLVASCFGFFGEIFVHKFRKSKPQVISLVS